MPSSLNGYAFNPLDRRSDARGPDSVATALDEAAARFYLFAGETILFGPLFTRAEAIERDADFERAVLLGFLDGAPRLAASVPGAHDGLDLRSIAVEGRLPPEHLGPLAQAKSLLDWHARHGFCARCGSPTRMTQGGYRRDCDVCQAQHFPRTDPVVIMLAVDLKSDRALLGRQPRFQPGMYSALAGFVEPGETIEDAVRRETREEAGVDVGRVRYYSSQPWPFPSSLMIGCHAEALNTHIVVDREELEDARWIGRDDLGLMLERRHPDGLGAPPSIAIAHHLIKSFVERGADALDRPI